MSARFTKLSKKFELASLWQRVMAEIIDWIICFVLVSITAFFIFMFLSLNFISNFNVPDFGSTIVQISGLLVYVFLISVIIGYYTVLESSAWQATIGK